MINVLKGLIDLYFVDSTGQADFVELQHDHGSSFCMPFLLDLAAELECKLDED